MTRIPFPNAILEDGGAVNLNVLANDFLQSGSTGTLALDPAGLTQPANGTVAIVGIADPLHAQRQFLRHRHICVSGDRWSGQLGHGHGDRDGDERERCARRP